MLLDNGFLTDLRTGAAGGLAADLLAKKDVEQVAVIGAGIQGRYQLRALLGVRTPVRAVICDLDAAAAEPTPAEMSALHRLPVTVAASVQEAVEGSDVDRLHDPVPRRPSSWPTGCGPARTSPPWARTTR